MQQNTDIYIISQNGIDRSMNSHDRKSPGYRNFDSRDKKKKPTRQRLKEDDKKEEVVATPEKERPVIPQFDFTPGYFKEPLPVSRPVPNNVDARGSRDSSASRPDSRSQEDEVIRKKNELNDAKSADSTDVPTTDAKETVIPTAGKQVLQYDYKEDQWSPINMEGKRVYDRQFLLKLQNARDSVTKPDGLPNLPEVVLETIQQGRDAVMNSGGRSHFTGLTDFTPGYVRSGGGTPRGMPPKRGSQTRGGSRSKPPMVINIQRESVDLHRTDNAYKTFNKTVESQDEDVAVIRQFRGILNKLTPQKFQTLLAQILQLPINTELRLKNTIDTIFEKALDEPGFSVAYANACVHLSKHLVVETEDKQKISFKKLLLNRCQQEFQKDKTDKTEFEAMEKEMEEATNEAKKKKVPTATLR